MTLRPSAVDLENRGGKSADLVHLDVVGLKREDADDAVEVDEKAIERNPRISHVETVISTHAEPEEHPFVLGKGRDSGEPFGLLFGLVNDSDAHAHHRSVGGNENDVTGGAHGFLNEDAGELTSALVSNASEPPSEPS